MLIIGKSSLLLGTNHLSHHNATEKIVVLLLVSNEESTLCTNIAPTRPKTSNSSVNSSEMWSQHDLSSEGWRWLVCVQRDCGRRIKQGQGKGRHCSWVPGLQAPGNRSPAGRGFGWLEWWVLAVSGACALLQVVQPSCLRSRGGWKAGTQMSPLLGTEGPARKCHV